MDANAKLGKEVIKSDPNPRSSNGDLLFELCERNNLIICNATDLCQGVITRERKTILGYERSILDYFILCEEMFSYLSSMKIDEARSYVLTKYSKMRGKTILTESDHNPIICQFNYLWNDATVNEKQRYEVFNFKDTDGLLKFNELTSADTLSACFNYGDIKVCGKKWLKAFKNILHRSFKKIRINNKQFKNEEVYSLMKAKTQILDKIHEIMLKIEQNPENIHIQSKILVTLKEAVDSLDKKIANLCANY